MAFGGAIALKLVLLLHQLSPFVTDFDTNEQSSVVGERGWGERNREDCASTEILFSR